MGMNVTVGYVEWISVGEHVFPVIRVHNVALNIDRAFALSKRAAEQCSCEQCDVVFAFIHYLGTHLRLHDSMKPAPTKKHIGFNDIRTMLLRAKEVFQNKHILLVKLNNGYTILTCNACNYEVLRSNSIGLYTNSLL